MFQDAPWHSPLQLRRLSHVGQSLTKIKMKMAMANRTSRFYHAYGSIGVRPSLSQPKLLKVSTGDKDAFVLQQISCVPCDMASMTIFNLNIFHAVEVAKYRKPEKNSGWPWIEITSGLASGFVSKAHSQCRWRWVHLLRVAKWIKRKLWQAMAS